MSELTHEDIHRLSVEEVLRQLATTEAGLASHEASRRLQEYGPNMLLEPGRSSLLRNLNRHFTHFLAILLWIAAGLSFLADWLNPDESMATIGWAIVAVIVINAVFAFIQEYKAEQTFAALRRLLPDKAWVMRDGQPVEIERRNIVPGDLLILEEGECVPADARLIEAIGMRVDNAALTGEAHPKRRTADPVADGHRLDLPNLVFAGTTILSGHGRAVVFATGMRSEFGKVTALATATEAGASPLRLEIAKVTRTVAALSVTIGIASFLIGLWTGLSLWTSFVFGIGIIVANVPEGLLPTVTLALAMSSQRMAKRNMLIKHLPAVETLGCTTVICTDKTGTLTENRMKVDRFYVDGMVVESREACFVAAGRLISLAEAHRWRRFFDVLLHCHNAKRIRRADGRWTATGDPTEVALLEFVIDHGLAHRPSLRRMGELPFDADRKRMSTLHWSEGRLLAFTKGAPESVLPLCTAILLNGTSHPLTEEERATITNQSRAFAEQAHRVLAIAMREVAHQPERIEVETIERDLTFLGLVAMVDPPRREVPAAVAICRQAGVRVVMITGDHPLTALAVAREIGLVAGQRTEDANVPPTVIEGTQLDHLSDEQLRELLKPSPVGSPPLFARMAPRHKLRVVSILKDMGEVVAVTGDGVNDAPALKRADIGVAMGLSGSDVAKETADMIVLDDNFATIVYAIEEGRTVYDNIRKFSTYILASNVPEIVPFVGYGLAGWPLALTVPQILAVDLGTDMIPALGLGAERPHIDVMDRPPRDRRERMLNLPLLLRAYLFLGVIEAVTAMTAFFLYLTSQGWVWGTPLDWSSPLYREATTVTLAAIVLAQVANVFACRSDHLSVARIGWFSNPLILWGILAELVIFAFVAYTPIGHRLFGTSSLPPWIFGPLTMGGAGLLLAEEGRKLFVNRLRRRPSPLAQRELPA